MQTDKKKGRFCNKVLGIPQCVANGAAEVEMGRVCRRGKIMKMTRNIGKEIQKEYPRQS
jgi:hypothetical protein